MSTTPTMETIMGIKIDVTDVVDPYAMDADSECELRIIDVRQDNNKNGDPYLMPRFEVVGEVAAKEFSYYMGIPTDSMNAKQVNAAASKYRKFCLAFGIDAADEQDPEDWIGLEGVAILGLEETPEYGEQNYIKRYVTGA